MKTLRALVVRNSKLFFRDKGMLLSSMITPMVLIVLYATFLAKVYQDSFTDAIPEGIEVAENLVNGTVASLLGAALLSVTCVTVTFCVNLTMIIDHSTGSRKDFDIAPISKPTLYIGYFISTLINSLIVNAIGVMVCLLYVMYMGWYLTSLDIIFILFDVLLLVFFGTALSSIICYPLKTQGQSSAVGTIVSAGYGFICGAYMPISGFGEGLKNVLSVLPGTYGTALIKNHMLAGVFRQMEMDGMPNEIIEEIAKAVDCRPVFNDSVVTVNQMFVIMIAAGIVLTLIYLMMAAFLKRR